MAINRPKVRQVNIPCIKLFVKEAPYALSTFKYTFAPLKNVNTGFTSYQDLWAAEGCR